MTESEVQQVQAAIQAAPQGLYNFNLNLTGQLQLAGQETDTIAATVDEAIQTNQAPPESEVQQVQAAIQAAPQGLYNFNLNLTGQLQLAAQETDTIAATVDEAIQTSESG